MFSQNTTFAVERILESQGKLGLLNLFVQFLLRQRDGYNTDVWSCTIQICLWELQTKLSFPLPQTSFWQRRQLRTKLTKHGAAPAKGEVQASYFVFLIGQRLLAGLNFWLLVKLSHARYYFVHYLGNVAEFPSSSVFDNLQSITGMVHPALRQGQGLGLFGFWGPLHS